MCGVRFDSAPVKLHARANTHASHACSGERRQRACTRHGQRNGGLCCARARTRIHSRVLSSRTGDVEMHYEYSTERTRHGCARIHYSFPQRHERELAFSAPKCGAAKQTAERKAKKVRIFVFRRFFSHFRIRARLIREREIER